MRSTGAACPPPADRRSVDRGRRWLRSPGGRVRRLHGGCAPGRIGGATGGGKAAGRRRPSSLVRAGGCVPAPVPGRELRRRGLHPGPASLCGSTAGDFRTRPCPEPGWCARGGVVQQAQHEGGHRVLDSSSDLVAVCPRFTEIRGRPPSAWPRAAFEVSWLRRAGARHGVHALLVCGYVIRARPRRSGGVAGGGRVADQRLPKCRTVPFAVPDASPASRSPDRS